MLFVRERGLAASTVRERGDTAGLPFLAQHLFDKGLPNVKLLGYLRDGVVTLLVSGHDSFT